MGNNPYLSENDISLIKEMLASKGNYTEIEVKTFIAKCEHVRLSPINNEICPMGFGGKLASIVTIDGLRVLAHRENKCTGIKTEIIHDQKGGIYGAKGIVHKEGNEYTSNILFKEYTTNSGLWKSKPATMVQKVAEAHAIRRAFPAETSGLYIEDEMSKPDQSKPEPKINIADLNKRASDLKKLATEKGIDIKNGFAPDLLDEINTAFKVKDRSKIEPLLGALEQKINAYSPPPKDSLETVILMAEGQGIPRDVFTETFKAEIDEYAKATTETNLQEAERITGLLIEEVRDYNKPLKNQEAK